LTDFDDYIIFLLRHCLLLVTCAQVDEELKQKLYF